MNDARPETPDGFSLALNFLPLALVLTGAALGVSASSALAGWLIFLVWLYLAPPALGRALIAFAGKPVGKFGQSDRGYRVWWAMTQLQMPFNRFPALEEALRIAPGLYPCWIALWGGRLSPFAFVGPGATIVDRHLVHVAPGAVLGLKSTLVGHMALRDGDGRWRVVVAAPSVGAGAIVGGGAGLGPGAILETGALLPSGRRIGPFDRWPRAARVKEDDLADA